MSVFPYSEPVIFWYADAAAERGGHERALDEMRAMAEDEARRREDTADDDGSAGGGARAGVGARPPPPPRRTPTKAKPRAADAASTCPGNLKPDADWLDSNFT